MGPAAVRHRDCAARPGHKVVRGDEQVQGLMKATGQGVCRGSSMEQEVDQSLEPEEAMAQVGLGEQLNIFTCVKNQKTPCASRQGPAQSLLDSSVMITPWDWPIGWANGSRRRSVATVLLSNCKKECDVGCRLLAGTNMTRVNPSSSGAQAHQKQ